VTSPSAGLLTEDQVAEFEERGFVTLRELTTADEVVSLQRTYDELFDPATEIEPSDRVQLAGDRALPQILNPDRYAPQLRDTVALQQATEVARRLLGPQAELMGMHAIRKPAWSGAETPWHQDEAYWDPSFEHRAISCWVPLQPVTVVNGCLHFVPGSHLDELREHELTAPEVAEGLQVTDQAAVTGAVACPLPAGGASVHAGRTLHYAGPNHTDEPRRALVMAFRTPPVWRGKRSVPWQPGSWYDDPG
jgi:ectoine hydroxylase-related dioxygenase (phytanoyl-CoA dioxygenase family)